MEEEAKRVKVIDRRHFNSEGERRELRDDEKLPDRRADENTEPAREPGKDTPAADEGFKELVLFLVQNGLAALGQIPGPSGRNPDINIEAAATMIGWLDSIEKKTRNNLAAEEKQLVNGYLYQLKMLYVKAKQGGKP